MAYGIIQKKYGIICGQSLVASSLQYITTGGQIDYSGSHAMMLAASIMSFHELDMLNPHMRSF